MPAITLTTLQSLKQKGEKITMLTCYDATFAHACNQAGVEVLLVGDSLGMVLQGHDSTLPVTTSEMAYHVACVKRGNQDALILADMPFMANATLEQTLNNSAQLLKAGAAGGEVQAGKNLRALTAMLFQQDDQGLLLRQDIFQQRHVAAMEGDRLGA